jgi:hypothetical protein
MKPLDAELRSALRRKEPPKGFAERVLARVISQPVVIRDPRPLAAWLGRRTILRWAAAAVLACLLGLGFAEYHQRREGERAKAQVMLALHIAGSQLNGTLEDVVQMNTSHPASGENGKPSLEEKEPLL